jgi:hypothetical protein
LSAWLTVTRALAAAHTDGMRNLRNEARNPETSAERLHELIHLAGDRGGQESDAVALGYVSSDLHPGKRAFRVYPAWFTDLNSQASRTQRAQGAAFSELPPRALRTVTENDFDSAR